MNGTVLKTNKSVCIVGLVCIATLLFAGCEREESHAVEQLEMVPLETVAASDQHKLWLANLPEYSRGYDPARDPYADLDLAKIAATKTNKLIFVVVGGDWCSWCHVMTRFFSQNVVLQKDLTSNYELLKVNMSEANANEEFLAQYPEIDGYPHIFILSSAGHLLHSQDTFKLEQGNSYSAEKFNVFLRRFRND